MKKSDYAHYAEIRDRLGLRDLDVARAADLNPAMFSHWKSGRSVPKVDKLLRIATVLNVGVGEFI